MQIIAYLAAVCIGLILGIIGAGGSILTVPVLVYLFKFPIVAATGSSLLIVGVISLIGSIQYYKQGLVDLQKVVLFGIPSVIAVFLTRAFIVPSIPDPIITFEDWEISKRFFILWMFACLIIASGINMLRKKSTPNTETEFKQASILKIGLLGVLVGLITSFVGAGGGFLIIPALVFLFKLDMKMAVGTSMTIIMLNTLLGFAGEPNKSNLPWEPIAYIIACAIVGMQLGIWASKKLDGAIIKKLFSWFIIIIGVMILITESFR